MKISKFFILIAFIIFILITPIYASSVVMDLENNLLDDTTTNQIENNTISDNFVENNIVNDEYLNNFSNNNVSTTSTIQTSTPKVTTTSSNNDEFLTVENILSISLIVIGILLAFLSIAILIRCK